MVGEVTIMLGDMFVQLLALFERVYSALDGWAIWIGAFTIFTIARMLIIPILGGVISAGQSDIVKEIRKGASSDKAKKPSGKKGSSDNG